MPDAVRRCRASAHAERVSAYRPTSGDMAVLVQQMVEADAAGVAFTANPVTGARDEVVVTAVTGLGESLVSGDAVGEEWIVRPGEAELTRAGGVLTADQATASPSAGQADDRAAWLLPGLDEGFRQGMRETGGAAVPFAYAVINGWYYTKPTPSPRALLPAIIRSRGRLLHFMINALIRAERDPAGADRALLGRLYRQWHDDLLPTYRTLVDHPPDQPIDALGRMAGRHLWYLAVVGGAAWKMETCLAHFIERHHLGQQAQVLLSGLPGTDRPKLAGSGPRQPYRLRHYRAGGQRRPGHRTGTARARSRRLRQGQAW